MRRGREVGQYADHHQSALRLSPDLGCPPARGERARGAHLPRRRSYETSAGSGPAAVKAICCASFHQGVDVGGNQIERNAVFHQLSGGGIRLLLVPRRFNVAMIQLYRRDGSGGTIPFAIRSMGRAQLGILLERRDPDDIGAFLRSPTGRNPNQKPIPALLCGIR
jgi:hypothetical protein